MPSKLMTPGVYIEEKNAFPSSAVSVETAVPAFIGYTEKAEWNGKSLLNKPTRITSFAEYVERFGNGFQAKFKIAAATADDKNETFSIGNNQKVVSINKNHTFYLFNSIRLFYANGGGPCYIVAVGVYKDTPSGLEISKTDLLAPLELLKKEFEPTLIVIPDAVSLPTAKDCYDVYVQVLKHCAFTQSRFGIFDTVRQNPNQETKDIIPDFRLAIGMDDLKYGAAYYPWLKTSIVQPSEVNHTNLDASVDLSIVLPATETNAIDVIKVYKASFSTEDKDAKLQTLTKAYNDADEKTKVKAKSDLDAFAATITDENLKAAATAVAAAKATLKKANDDLVKANTASPVMPKDVATATDALKKANDALVALAQKNYPTLNDKVNYHQSLKATSPTYNNIMNEIRSKMNELPPSAAMAGIYTNVDNSRGVWKSPANVSVAMVNAPSINISNEQQEDLNVDVQGGKSINVIRTFPGIGTLVWGGRTLDGNSQDWRYINVRRTLIMIEQSLKLASRSYVFEPNDANTWITVKSMMNNFLTNLWKQGALAGAAPEQAFDVQIGLGATMTANDILDGKMLITVKVAIVRPAEFIVITFQQQMQQS